MNPPRGTLRSSLVWNTVSLGGRQGVRLVTALILARLLGPADFGVANQAIVTVTLVALLATFGLVPVLVQRPDLGERHRHAAAWLSAATGTAAAAVTFATAGPVAALFDSPELVAVMRVLSLLVLLKAVAVTPTALLMRDLRFESLARAELAAAVGGALVGIAGAAAGARYWAPVAQMLATDTILVALLVRVERPRLGPTDRAAVGDIARFGGAVVSTNAVNYASNNGDNLLIGAVLGRTPLGLYALAYRVLSIPLQVVGQTVSRTVLPAFSRAQDEPRRVADLYATSMRGVAVLITGPLVLVALAAGDAIPWVFGPEWRGAVTATRWIAIAGILRLVFGAAGTLMVSVGRPGWQFGWSAFTTVVSLVGFTIGMYGWGIDGVAASIVVLGLPTGIASVWLVSRLVPLDTVRALAGLLPATAAAGVSTLVWFLVSGPTADLAVPARLALRGAAAALAYLAVLAASPGVRRDLADLAGTSTTPDPDDGAAAADGEGGTTRSRSTS